MSLKVWGWILAILALANMVRIVIVSKANNIFNWVASLIVLLIAIILLSKKGKKKAIAKPVKKKKK